MKKAWLGPVVVAAMVAFIAAVFAALPEPMPVHWNAAGRPDRWTSRWAATLPFPAVALALWLLAWLLPRVDPRRAHYARFRETYWIIINLILLFTLLIQVFALGTALGWPVDMTRLVLAAVGVLFIGLGHYLPRVRSNWWMGVRTPWTLESERVWRETHRLAGRTFVIGGAITLVAAFLPSGLRPWVALAGLLIGAFLPIAYSYFAWRRERRERGA